MGYLRLKKERRTVNRFILGYRVVRRFVYQSWKFLIYAGFLCWLRRVYNRGLLPKRGPAIIVSNHASYFDWAVLSAVFWDKLLVMYANQDILERPFVGWLMWMNIPIFIDPQNPGQSSLREGLRYLRDGQVLAIYPEGTRTRTGKMLKPKIGFVMLALMSGAPIVPVAMKGTYDVLPPHKHLPSFKRCEIIVGHPIFVNSRNALFADLFVAKGGRMTLKKGGAQVAANRIMEIVRKMSGQEWEEVPTDNV